METANSDEYNKSENESTDPLICCTRDRHIRNAILLVIDTDINLYRDLDRYRHTHICTYTCMYIRVYVYMQYVNDTLTLSLVNHNEGRSQRTT